MSAPQSRGTAAARLTRRPRLSTLIGLVAASLITAGLVAAVSPPAQASGKPQPIGQVKILAASTTSLTIMWPRSSGADRYRIERGTNLNMVQRKEVETTKARSIKITNLKPDSLYCFQVRAENKRGLGERSRKACQRTVGTQSGAKGARYRVITYNTCSMACSRWGERLPAAARLVRAQNPDVVMAQETDDDSGLAGKIGNMKQAVAKNGKVLLFKSRRFDIARTKSGNKRVGYIDLGNDPRYDKRRYAVWAELIDRANRKKRVIFVSVHLSQGGDGKRADDLRRKNTKLMVKGLARINDQKRPLVIGGDFNSHQGRTHNSPQTVMKKAGFASAFFRAHRWTRGHINSATQGRKEPVVGNPWGYHIDQVWTQAKRTRVEHWANANQIKSGRYTDPKVSDHSPVLVEVRVGG